MREYIVMRRFQLGERDIYLEAGERVKFDGVNAIIRGDDLKAPTLMSAVRSKWLEAAETDELGRPLEKQEVPEENSGEKAKRMKEERLTKVRGAIGNGVSLEEVLSKQAVKRTPLKKKVAEPSNEKVRVVETSESFEQVVKRATANRPVVYETEGIEVGKTKSSVVKAGIEQENDPKSFYEAMLEGEVKHLDVDKDQYIPKKMPVMTVDSQDDAVVVKKLGIADQIGVVANPLKDWKSKTAKRKETFIKKEKDKVVLSKIVEMETGDVRRKARTRLEEID